MILFVRPASVLAFVLLLLGLPGAARANKGDLPVRIYPIYHCPHAAEPRTAASTIVMRGRASWYGVYFQGRRTANDERYDRFAYTCAHKTLPFNTRIRVTCLRNGKAVVVRVSDRGPYRRHRIIDLSEIAARPLGITETGSDGVIAEVVDRDTPLGPATAPANLAVLRAADPHPDAAFTTYNVAEPLRAATLAQTTALAALLQLEAPAGVPPVAEPVGVAEPLGTAAAAHPVSFFVQAGSFIEPAAATALQAKIQALDPSLSVQISDDLLDGRQRARVLVGTFGERPQAEALRRRLLLWGIGGLVREVALR